MPSGQKRKLKGLHNVILETNTVIFGTNIVILGTNILIPWANTIMFEGKGVLVGVPTTYDIYVFKLIFNIHPPIKNLRIRGPTYGPPCLYLSGVILFPFGIFHI